MKDTLSSIYFIHIIFSFSNIFENIPLVDFLSVLVFQTSVLTYGVWVHGIETVRLFP